MKRPVELGRVVRRAHGIWCLWMLQMSILITNYSIFVAIYLAEHPVRVDMLQGVAGSGERNLWNTLFFWFVLCVENLHSENKCECCVIRWGFINILFTLWDTRLSNMQMWFKRHIPWLYVQLFLFQIHFAI